MIVHHISCGFFRTPVAALTYGSGGWLARGPYVIHCLLIELSEAEGGGLALVDTGLSDHDVKEPMWRLGLGMTFGGGATRGMSALGHVKRIGRKAEDVRHIMMTHLDKDHAGGLGDFPEAFIHVHPAERAAALERESLIDRQRYSAAHVTHAPRWVPLDLAAARPWMEEFRSHQLPGLPPSILMIELPGHSDGHCGVALETESGWILHCGDAVYHAAALRGPMHRPPLVIQGVETLLQSNARARAETVFKLQRLVAKGEVRVFCSHDPVAFQELGGKHG